MRKLGSLNCIRIAEMCDVTFVSVQLLSIMSRDMSRAIASEKIFFAHCHIVNTIKI